MTAPLILEATPAVGGISLRVVGAAATPFAGSFVLDVAAGGNRSTHHGTARLAPGEAAVLSTVMVSTGDAGTWRAVLRVTPADGAAYEQVSEPTDDR